jgi:DNA-binding NarL/FixJ family response regulator
VPASIDARLLELVGDVLGIVERDELREALLVALDRAVPSDWVSINEVGPHPADMCSVVRPALPERLHEAWAQYGNENPLIARFARTLDTRPYRFSDVITTEELHALALYRDFYAELPLEHQIAFVVSVSPPRYVGIALSRSATDFTDEERTLLDRARPFLIAIYRTAIAHGELSASAAVQLERLAGLGLTRREAIVLAGVARGRSNADVARDLGVSERTVGKHLQRTYRKLGVANRSQAAAIAWGH